MNSIFKSACGLTICFLIIGCQGNNSSDDSAVDVPSAASAIVSLLIVDDDRLTPVIKRQWLARTENEIQIQETSFQALAKSNFESLANVDVVIYPSGLIGEFASRDLVRAFDKDDLDDTEFNRRELLRFDREELVRWGEKTVAISLGAGIPVLLCREDVLTQLDAKPPKSWEEFSDLVKKIDALDPSSALPRSVLVPLADHWASHALHIRVASAIKLRGKISTLFNVDTMKSLISSEPFLRALQGWDRDLPEDVQELSPKGVLAAYARGDLAMAVTTVNGSWLDGVDELPGTIIAPVPGSEEQFDESRGGWTARTDSEEISVTTLGIDGLLASVTRETTNSRLATKFALWLGQKQMSIVIGPQSTQTGMSRKSHLAQPATWIGNRFSDDAGRQYSDVVRNANESAVGLMSLRVPDRDRYLDAMNQAVLSVLRDEANAVEALDELSNRWDVIVDELGRDKQRTAYRQSEGLRE